MAWKRRQLYNYTIQACFVAYIVQAIGNNFAPLLFLTFQSAYGIPLSKITLLITFNFCIQLLIDALSARFIDKKAIGLRLCWPISVLRRGWCFWLFCRSFCRIRSRAFCLRWRSTRWGEGYRGSGKSDCGSLSCKK